MCFFPEKKKNIFKVSLYISKKKKIIYKTTSIALRNLIV